MLVSWCSPTVRSVLARGPVAGIGCGVCDALDEMRDWTKEMVAAHPEWGTLPIHELPVSPAQRRRLASMLALHEWHEGEDLVASHGVIPGYGPEVYARCLVVYRAAGWCEVPTTVVH